MLLRFVAQNFLSIADEVELNMFPAPRLRKHPNHVYQTPQVDLLKAAAIYGANGAGKSNIVKAMAYLKQIVVDGDISNPFENNEIKFKLSEEFQKKPTHFEIEFKQDEKYYSYGIDFDEHVIYEEWLYTLDIKTEKDELIFERKLIDDKIKLNLHPSYLQTEKDRIRIELYEEEMLKIYTPFIEFGQNTKLAVFSNIQNWFHYLELIFPETKYELVDKIATDEDFLNFTNSIISKLDTGIKNISVTTKNYDEVYRHHEDFEIIKSSYETDLDERELHGLSPTMILGNGYLLFKKDDELKIHILKTNHSDNSENTIYFDVDEESDGTNRLFDLVPVLDLLVNQEGLIVIDEIGRSLHPSLLKKLVTLIMKTPTKGQIIFTTHDSHLLDLDIFRPDEIWFVEKNKEGKTKAYTMSDFKPRYDENIEKGYLMGRFGAIPYLGDLDKLELELSKEIANTH